jgi:hypothetical protein
MRWHFLLMASVYQAARSPGALARFEKRRSFAGARITWAEPGGKAAIFGLSRIAQDGRNILPARKISRRTCYVRIGSSESDTSRLSFAGAPRSAVFCALGRICGNCRNPIRGQTRRETRKPVQAAGDRLKTIRAWDAQPKFSRYVERLPLRT